MAPIVLALPANKETPVLHTEVSEEKNTKRKNTEDEVDMEEFKRRKLPRQAKSSTVVEDSSSNGVNNGINPNASGVETITSSFGSVNLEMKVPEKQADQNPYVLLDESLFSDDNQFYNFNFCYLDNVADLLVGPLFDLTCNHHLRRVHKRIPAEN
ncbi:hypothetical protein COLO4_21909 [Corchorus olitorius]|uniref:Uncharacterized protein n=1 Tax=Corchorus olitorius TaxID=93759 RepID=A0A1R3IPY7_9ROSI|nr:hypothetical protein COLO4_21909 [Corchorus olitorius]